MSAMRFKEEEFSPLERAALAAWRTPAPPVDFADRVLARASAEPRAAPARGGRLAVAALALLVLGGVLSVRGMVGRPSGTPAYDLPGGFGAYDAGQRPEVREEFDGVQRHPS